MTCQGVCRKIEFDYRKYVCYMPSLPLEENLPEMQILSGSLTHQNRKILSHFILHNPIQVLREKVLQKQSVN